jgi:hypothetical protein
VASGWLIQPTKQFYYRRVRYWWVGGWCVIPGINLQYSGGAGWEGKGSPPSTTGWPYKWDDLIWTDQQLSLASSPSNIPTLVSLLF